MKVFKYLQVALESIVAHKMRAILTMLGIIIGVAAVVWAARAAPPARSPLVMPTT